MACLLPSEIEPKIKRVECVVQAIMRNANGKNKAGEGEEVLGAHFHSVGHRRLHYNKTGVSTHSTR